LFDARSQKNGLENESEKAQAKKSSRELSSNEVRKATKRFLLGGYSAGSNVKKTTSTVVFSENGLESESEKVQS